MHTTQFMVVDSGTNWAGHSAAGEARRRSDLIAHDMEVVQLQRLASAVLSKSVDDLTALQSNNPELIWEWQAAFRQQKLEAEAAARFWSAAMASLATIPTEAEAAAPVAAE